MTASLPRASDLGPLVASLDDARVTGDAERVVTAIAHDSRAVRPGTLFVALRGERADGHEFLRAAFAAGACAAVVARDALTTLDVPPGATLVAVDDPRRALSRLAAAFYDDPSRALFAIGVTGTNGKTTTTHLIATILEAGGIATGCIGTLGAHFGAIDRPLANTTPLALELQGLLADMRDGGAEAVALEASSHALATGRVADVRFAVGVLTNVTRDHLDFHGSLEAYARAKRMLFELSVERVFNLDDDYGSRFASEFAGGPRGVRTYGMSAQAWVRAADVASDAAGSTFRLDGLPVRLPLPGRFNVSNALAAIAVARTLGVADTTSARALAGFVAVAGRMERFAAAGVAAIVDYAHTPGALTAVLSAVREAGVRRLCVVFGCGGDRDRGKRADMGRIASELAECVYVTNDNPRGEAPQAIADQVLAGMRPGATVTVELDRRAAIRRAIGQAEPGDVVVVAGKGHENYQIVGDRALPFDDRDEVRAALAERAGAPA